MNVSPARAFWGALPLIALALVALAFADQPVRTSAGARLVLQDLGPVVIEDVGHARLAPARHERRAPAPRFPREVILEVDPLPPAPTRPGVPASAIPPPYRLVIPVAGVTADQLFDSFGDARDSTRVHRAIDILAPVGTPVVAAVAGRIARISESRLGGLTLHLADHAGAYVYYYAHLDGYAEGLRPGQHVLPGDTLGYVGATGNADEAVPHLHFAIWKKRSGSSGWGGAPVNPYPLLAQR